MSAALPVRVTTAVAAAVLAPIIANLVSAKQDEAALEKILAEDGSVRDDICFWGDARPFSHAMNFFSKRAVQCRIVFGAPLPPSDDRKRLAAWAHAWVLAQAYQKESSAAAAELLPADN